MSRFTILQHDSPRGIHWDFLLETGGTLRAWALPQPPAVQAELICDALADHRLVYLDYEGPIPGDRGSVTRWDWGTYELCEETADTLVLDLRGRELAGRVTLRRVAEQPERWRFSMDWPVAPAAGA